ncbi:MAG: hypothetical protein ACK5D7_03925 [Planctomycetota bacterium]
MIRLGPALATLLAVICLSTAAFAQLDGGGSGGGGGGTGGGGGGGAGGGANSVNQGGAGGSGLVVIRWTL